MAKSKPADRHAKYEVIDYSLSTTERADLNAKNMVKAVIIDLEFRIEQYWSRKGSKREWDLLDFIGEIREVLKDEDLKSLLNKERMRLRYHTETSRLKARARRAYWNARKRGLKEKEAVASELRVLAETYERRHGVYEGMDTVMKNKRKGGKGRKPKIVLGE